MRENITKVVERQERLDSLQDKTGLYFSYNFTHTSVAIPIWSLVVMVKPYGTGPNAHASHRQSCRFCSRLQTQCESGPEGMFLSCFSV